MNKGPLVRVKIGPSRYAKMHKADAIARGLIAELEPKKKQRRPAANKMRRGPVQNKTQESEPKLEYEPTMLDDFALIRGIGTTTAALLYGKGIYTFSQLLDADVSWLPGRTRRAIEDWKREH